MALVVFLRGVNVGGYRTFRPSLLAHELRRFSVVNIGAAGTFVVRARVSQRTLRTELTRRLPFDTHVMICSGADLLHLTSSSPFDGQPSGPDVVQFVSVLGKARRPPRPLPCEFPAEGPWQLRVVGQQNRFVFGLYRRTMKAIGHLGQIDRLFGSPATTRSWTTMLAIARLLQTPRDRRGSTVSA
jgi:uncharacterized protein (DUF1697 family)